MMYRNLNLYLMGEKAQFGVNLFNLVRMTLACIQFLSRLAAKLFCK